MGSKAAPPRPSRLINARRPIGDTGALMSRTGVREFSSCDIIFLSFPARLFTRVCFDNERHYRRIGSRKITREERVTQIARRLGDEITIRRFVRFQVGESA